MSHQFAFATASLNRGKKGLDLRGGIGMVNARFEIGTIEKHTNKAIVSIWTARVQIWVDDREIINTHQNGLRPKSYEFQVETLKNTMLK
jgi:hypothetical protein